MKNHMWQEARSAMGHNAEMECARPSHCINDV